MKSSRLARSGRFLQRWPEVAWYGCVAVIVVSMLVVRGFGG